MPVDSFLCVVRYVDISLDNQSQSLDNQLQKVETCSTFCNDFKQLSALLRSQTSPLSSVNACAMFRATCLNALRDKLHEKLHSVTARLRYSTTCLTVAT